MNVSLRVMQVIKLYNECITESDTDD